MKCPRCNSTKTRKNGHRKSKQCYQCCACGRNFVESPKFRPYSEEIKQLCLKMYLNSMGLRGIERVTEIHHTTIINWIKTAGIELPDSPEEDEIPEITEIDELQQRDCTSCLRSSVPYAQTFVGNKRNKIWIWTVVNHWQPGILKWKIGDRGLPRPDLAVVLPFLVLEVDINV